ncbi:MAG: hypothetical protein C5S48_06095 [Candidatus Methanogaster sp.]|nr:MAG: hypothetical protein C5S48_06095 [ANME-2 cluster archaeon]
MRSFIFRHLLKTTESVRIRKLLKKGGWLSESPTNGTVYTDSQTTINVTFSTTGLPSGEYSANITITSNDLDENQVVIPVRLNVIPSQNGDLNHDSEITPADAVIALRIAVDDGHASEADVDGNGCVNVLDALMIMQAAAGAISLRGGGDVCATDGIGLPRFQ